MNLMVVVFKDRSEKTIVWATEKAAGLSFGTQLPGGFTTASVELPVRSWESARLYRLFLNCHMVIFDSWGRRVYEGRIEDLTVASKGLTAQATGYYSIASETTSGQYFPASDNYTARDLILSAVDMCSNSDANTVWRPDSSFIQANNTLVGEQDFRGEAKVVNQIEKALSFGAPTIALVPMHFAVWENRLPYYFAEPDPESGHYDWSVTIDAVDSDYSLTRSRKDVYNRIQAVYDDPLIGQAVTAWKEDKNSQTLFDVREGTINVGSTTEGVAGIALDYALKVSAYPEQSTSFNIKGRVISKWGTPDRLYMIRSGDLLRIDDFDPAGIQLLSGTGGRDTAIAFINRTEYNADDDTLSVELGHKNMSMDLMMSRLGLSGGSIS